MPEDTLRREIASLRRENAKLSRRVEDAEQAVGAFARGEVDAVDHEGSAKPLLLHAAQEKLRRSEALLRAIFDGALDAMLLAADDGAYIDANPAACALFRLPRAALIGRSLADFAAPDYDAAAAYRTFREQGSMRGVFPLRRLDGGARYVEFSALANVVPGVHLSILRDVTERIEAEQRLRASRDLLEEAQAIAHVGSWTSGLAHDAEIRWTRECYRIFGVPEGTTITVASLFSRVHPADREILSGAGRDVLERAVPLDVEHRVERPDGTVRWVHARAHVERDAAGAPVGMVGTVQDITDRHASLEALRASEERYRRIVEGTSDGVWTYDADGNTTFMNAQMAAMVGWTASDAVGRSVYAFIAEQDQPAARERTLRRLRGIGERTELRLQRKDGSEAWASVQANPIFAPDGRYDGGVALVTDISDQRRADEARARLAAIVDSSADAILSEALDGTITTWNRGAERLYQYTAAEIVGRSISMLMPPGMGDDEVHLLDQVARGGAVRHYETKRRRKDGALVEVALTVSPIRDAAGTVIGASKIARDLTAQRQIEAELRRTEDQFRQAQKLEAVGRLAGGVAHDFNNLLSVVLSYSDLATQELAPGDPVRDDIDQIRSAGRRAAGLTQQLLAFSRRQVLTPRVLDLGELLANMQKMLQRLVGEDIELTLLTGREVGRVLADPGQIDQVVMNIVVNARDAMPNGGQLTIETMNVDLGAEQVGAHLDVPAGEYVLLAISDTGVGMDAATRAHIFEPFFTTKEQGKGTGLGLATVFGIVKQSGGQISVDSEPGRGTTFKIYLPRTDRADVHAEDSAPPLALRGTETILLVEDEDQVRHVASAILRRHGYHVLEASNGGEAFLISRELDAKIHLLLTDVVMPRMSGRKLAEELTPQRPDMKVLFTSGYTDDAIVHHGVLHAGIAFLHKPFTPDGLLRKVREVLDGPARAGLGARA